MLCSTAGQSTYQRYAFDAKSMPLVPCLMAYFIEVGSCCVCSVASALLSVAPSRQCDLGFCCNVIFVAMSFLLQCHALHPEAPHCVAFTSLLAQLCFLPHCLCTSLTRSPHFVSHCHCTGLTLVPALCLTLSFHFSLLRATCQNLTFNSSSLSEARAALAPWVALLGQYLIHVGEQLQHLSTALAAMAAAPVGSVPHQQLKWSVKRGQQLADAIDCGSPWRRSLQQAWQDAARYDRIGSCGSGSQLAPVGSSRSSCNQQQPAGSSNVRQQQLADSRQFGAPTAGSAPAAYWLQHGDLAAEFASIASIVRSSLHAQPRS